MEYLGNSSRYFTVPGIASGISSRVALLADHVGGKRYAGGDGTPEEREWDAGRPDSTASSATLSANSRLRRDTPGVAPGQAEERRPLPRSIPLVVAIVAVVASIFATRAPTPALAHDGALSTVQGHVEEDSVAHHDPATERRLERRTSAATATDAEAAAAAVTGNEGQVGQWGPVVDWPVVAVNVALLENGKVLAYDSVGDNAAETYPVHDHTRATVWDPATGTADAGERDHGLQHLLQRPGPPHGRVPVRRRREQECPARGHRPDARLQPADQYVEPWAEHGGWPLVPERHPPAATGSC